MTILAPPGWHRPPYTFGPLFYDQFALHAEVAQPAEDNAAKADPRSAAGARCILVWR